MMIEPDDEIPVASDIKRHRALWSAVILQVLIDAETIFQRMARYLKRFGCSPSSAEIDLERLMKDVQGDWFETACSFVNLHPDHVYRKIQSIERAHSAQGRKVLSDEAIGEMIEKHEDLKC